MQLLRKDIQMVTPKISEERLAEIAARLKAASPAPWKYIKENPMFMGTADEVTGAALEIRGRAYRQYPNNFDAQVEPDAKFIAHAPEDIAYLLELVRGCSEEEPKMRHDLTKWCKSSRECCGGPVVDGTDYCDAHQEAV